MPKILIIDDDKELRRRCRAELETDGFEVVEAVDGQNGLAKALEHHPDLIILDIMMPKVNGLDVLDILSSTAGTSKTPVIILTALVQDEIKTRVEGRGAVYLVKNQYSSRKLARYVSRYFPGITGSNT